MARGEKTLGKDYENSLPPELPPNPDLLKKDPMADLFGPGSGTKLLGDPEDEIPEQVRVILETFNLSKKRFTCILKERIDNEDSDGVNGAYIKGWVSTIPSMEYIAKNYGPGKYAIMFSWKVTTEEGKTKTANEHIPIEISEKFMQDYKKHQLDRKIASAKEVSDKVKDALIEKKLENSMLEAFTGEEKAKIDPMEIAQAQVQKTMEFARTLGFIQAPPQLPATPQRSIEWDKLIPALITGVTAFMDMQQKQAALAREENNKLLMLLLSQNRQSSDQMVELMKVCQGVGSGNQAFKEIRDMIFGLIDIKGALSGEPKETVADKIFNMVQSIAPQILNIAAMTAQARANNPMVKMARTYVQSDPDFLAVRDNPEELRKFIGKLDASFGPDQTNIILREVGWKRPEGASPSLAEETVQAEHDVVRPGSPQVEEGEIVS